jgi:hypothetical protein
MNGPKWPQTLGVIALVLSAAACGDGASPDKIPTADELAASLVTTDDFEGDWTILQPPEGSEAPSSGVVPDDERDMLPTFDLCDAASVASRSAGTELQWKAFRQLDLTEEDPIEPPTDRTGHMIFVQEFLTSGEPNAIQTTFELLSDGLQACLGDVPADDEGPGTLALMALPDVGDERLGTLLTIEEDGGWAEWRLHNALVRDGNVLILLNVVDIRAGDGVEPFYTIDDVGHFVELAISHL